MSSHDDWYKWGKGLMRQMYPDTVPIHMGTTRAIFRVRDQEAWIKEARRRGEVDVENRHGRRFLKFL